MYRFLVATLATLAALMVTGAVANAAPQGTNTARERLDVYTGVVSPDQLREITALGVDRQEVKLSRAGGLSGKDAQVRVEAILSGRQVDRLKARGVNLEAKRIGGATAAQRATAEVNAGLSVFKQYSGPGGLQQEFAQIAAQNPKITKLVNYGKSVQGQNILALKISKDARTAKDGKKPSVLYMGAQHAREWITPEMVRRLAYHFVNNYKTSSAIRKLVDDNELWLVPVANPDGYDFTFQGQRLWRKNLRDNDGDQQITAVDGVDLNRNFPTRWGYDNEGSSPDPSSETFRGSSRGSEPETKALESLTRNVGFEFVVNYHSAAELLLYGLGWQVATPSPDDVLYEAMAGDDTQPAIPGYDPDISAELYTVNGDTDTDLQARFKVLGFTPEMATCESASAVDPGDAFEPADCGSIFEFPDSEPLIQAEFERNVPFALSVAKSAKDPDDPVSAVGRTAENFRIDSFDVSYGDPQKVAVVAKRAIKDVTMNYRVNGGRLRTAAAPEWQGGERYGDENDDYYVERRGVVRGTKAGDTVEVWFSGIDRRTVQSRHFTYTVKRNSGADVLVLANEDYTGVNPEPAPPGGGPKYADEHVAAVQAAGHRADVWDVDAQGVPHDLGVLSHYKAIVWYLGDNRFTQDPEDLITETPFGDFSDVAVAERQQYLTMAVRDFLNEGGKLVHDGETTQLVGQLDFITGGPYYGLNGDPDADCVISSPTGLTADCLILSDDFRQYYLGGFDRVSVAGQQGARGVATPITGFLGSFGGPALADNPLDEAGSFVTTSDVLPVAQFPQFASRRAAEYTAVPGGPYAPVEGTRYAAAAHADNSYMRLTRTIDLTGKSSAQLDFKLSADVEPFFDHVIVEARTVGQDNWTTLPDALGATTTNLPADCGLRDLHPFLAHYLGGADCSGPGSSGTWNAVTGSTSGWRAVSYDLTAFAGNPVEVSISYVTDQIIGGVGAFVDDTHVVVDGADSADGFEGPTSTWTIAGPPADSPPGSGSWAIGSDLLRINAGTSTQDTLLLGFGLEQLATAAERNDLMKRALAGLL